MEKFFNFLRGPKKYYLLIVLVLIASFFLYQKIFLKEELSEFQLTAKLSDAAGIEPETSFILKSSANLSATVVERYLRFEPEIEYSIKKIGTGSSVFEITPNSPLLEDTIYSVVIDESPIALRSYSWAYQVKAPFQIISSIPRNKATFVPAETIVEITFNRENLINPQSSFEISPSVRGKFEVNNNILTFIPSQRLLPQTIYTVKIKPGIKAQGSNDTLIEETEIKFETGGTETDERDIGFSRNFWEINPENETVFQVYFSGFDSNTVPLTIYRLDDANDFIESYKKSLTPESSWSYYHKHKLVNIPASKKVFESNVLAEEQNRTKFIRVPQKLSPGFYLAEVKNSQTWFQITPLANYSAISGTKTLLWLKDLSDNSDIINAEVFFQNRSIGRSNNDGVALFNTPDELIREIGESYHYSETTQHFYTINFKDKQLVIPIERSWGSFSKVNSPDSWWEYFSTDKTIYLPDDKVHFWGIVKQRNGTDIKGEKIKIKLTDPFWQEIPGDDVTVYGETEAVISDFYTVTGNISFSRIKPGYYQLGVYRGNEVIVSESINIKTYIKPAYKLTIIPDRKAVFAGETINYKVKAEFFEGTPVSNLKLKYNGYFTTNINGEIQLNEDGEGSFSVIPPYEETRYSYWPHYLGLTVSPSVAEEGEISANSSVLVFGPRINLQTEQKISETTSRFNLDLRSIVLNKIEKGAPWWVSDNYLGNPINNWKITANVTEIIYHREQVDTGYDAINKTTYPIYRYTTEEKLIKQEILTTNSNGQANYQWTAEKNKTYRITFTTRDSNQRQVQQQHYIYGSSYSYFGFYDASGARIINLDEDKNQYKINDTINLQMQNIGGQALESGPKRFIFVRVVNGIVSYQITDSPNFNETFKQSFIPNIEIIGSWFSGHRFVNTDWWSSNLSFDSDEHRLNIEVLKDKDRYRPRDKVNLEIKVTDKDGNPKQAEVNVSGIDEAVFSLNPIEKDIVRSLYQNIYSPTLVRSSHFSPLELGAEGGGCFTSDTLISTPNGKKLIKDLRVGDEVLTRQSDNSAKIVKTRIKQIGSYLVGGYLVVNDKLRLTLNHELFVNNSWKKAGEIKINDVLINQNNQLEKVVSLEIVKEWGLVYNIELEDYHTYFANGIYVHNEEKGGAMERADFRDIAIYQSIQTNSKGLAKVSFNVPDNLTSWRITTQAITKDLFAGKTIDFVPVGLPFFVETNLNKTYLAEDNLVLRLRVFGTANIRDDIKYSVESETLTFKKIEKVGSNVIEIPLGNLNSGNHKLKISATSNGHQDIIIRDLNVLTSYFSQESSEFYELSPNLTNIKKSIKGYTRLLFTSYERGRLYNQLQYLSNQNGARIDQKITAVLAKIYLNRFFDKQELTETFNALSYQYNDGITLLPYSDDDLELSAKFANLAHEESVIIDQKGLKEYFYSSITDKKSDLSRACIAFYGLSAFREPVLVSIQNIKDNRSLTLKDKIYLALALDGLGAKEEARRYYQINIKPSLTFKSPYLFLSQLESQDENILATTLLAGLTASLSEPETDNLSQYAIENYPKKTLKNFEMLLYMKKALPLMKGGDVSFSYQLSGKSNIKKLENNEVFELNLSQDEIKAIKFSDVKGRIGVTSVFEKETKPEEARKDTSINISRSYSVNNRKTNQFQEGDVVRIDLAPTFASNSLDGPYQVVDYLPSGLRAITNIQLMPFRPNTEYPRYPSIIEDQKVVFVVWKDFSEPFFYYARVINKGRYKAEPTLIQSLRSLESSNISKETDLIIR